MKIESNSSKILKKFDDTTKTNKQKRQTSNKLPQKPKAKKQSKRVLKMLPGQQILSFKPNILKTNQKTLDFICIEEKTMGWPEHFSNNLIPHDYDNDQQSNQQIINKQIQKGIASLVQQITFKKISEMEDTIGF